MTRGGRTRKKNTHTPRKKTEEEIFHSMSRKLVLDARITSVWWFYSFCVYFQFNFQLFIAVAGRELKLTDHVWSTACFLPLSHSVTHLLCFLVSITFVAVLILSNRLNGKRRRVLSFVANNDSLAWWSWTNKKPFLFNAINSHSSDSPLWLRIPSYYYVGFSNVIRNCKLVNKSRTQRNAEKSPFHRLL